MLNRFIKKGVSYGLTSGVLTTLGLMVGLDSSTNSRVAVIGGVLTIAIVDAMSDAIGIHISEESENRYTDNHIWEATVSTFLSKFIFAISFIVPILLFDFSVAIIISVIYGTLLLGVLSYGIAKIEKKTYFSVVFSHLLLALIIIVLTYYVGTLINIYFT